MSHPPSEHHTRLQQALDSQPIIVSPQTLVLDAVATMSHTRSTYLLVGTPQQVLGIVTEQDIVHCITKDRDLEQTAITKVMTQDIVTVSWQDPPDLFELFSQFRDSPHRHLPVLDEQGMVVGIVTPHSLHQVLQPTDLLLVRRVAEILSPHVLTASPQDSILEIAELMTQHQQSCVVICDQVRVVDHVKRSCSLETRPFPRGIITVRDIVQFKALKLDFTQTPGAEVMSVPLLEIRDTTSLWQAHQTMEKYHIRRLVVRDEWGYLAGVVTQSHLFQSLNPLNRYTTAELLEETIANQTQELQATNTSLKLEISRRQEIQEQLEQIEKRLREQVEQQTQQLRETNARLREEIKQRIQAEQEIRCFNKELEQKIKSRTQALEQEICERKLMEEKLRTTEEKMRAVFEAMTELVLILDDQQQHLEIMPTAVATFSNTEQDLVNQTIAMIFQGGEQSREVSHIQEVVRTRRSLNCDYCLWLQGEKRYFTANIAPLSDHTVIWVSREITERTQTEEALQLSEEKFSKAFRASPNPMAITTFDEGRFLDVNDSFLQISGYKRSEVLGHTTQDLNGWINDEASVSLRERLANQEAVRNLECKFRTKWGKTRTTLLSAETFNLNNTHCILSIANDITERKQAEESLRLIVEGTADTTGQEFFKSCVYYLAKALHVRYAIVSELISENSTHMRSLAFWEGDHWTDNIEYALPGTPCEQVIQNQIVYYPSHFQDAFPKDQYLVDLKVESYLGIPLKTFKGKVLGSLAVFDCHPMEDNPDRQLMLRVFAARTGAELERQQTEDALKIAKQEADQANQAKSNFLAHMSHELRTPLNCILGFTQLTLRDAALTEEQRSNLDIISNSGTHLLGLINDILDMSKIEAGQMTFNENCFDLSLLLESVEDIFQLKAKSKGLTLQVELGNHVPRYLKTDESKLRQVLTNLVGNGVKFTEQGQVTIRVINTTLASDPFLKIKGEAREDHESLTDISQYTLRFEITDTGPGINPQEQETLFAPFVQTKIGQDSQQGTGLGLSLSRGFVQLMGGEMTVQSHLGQGTTFTFEIPVISVYPQEIEREELRQVVGLAPDQPTYRILIVEDRRESRLLLSKMLKPIGFEVKEAINGKEAIAAWETWKPHLIWMDMRMPVMNGFEATQYIKSQLKGQATVIIALTASALEQDKAIVLSTGCDDFVRKPFQESIIFDKLAQYLGVSYIYKDPEILKSQPANLDNYSETLGSQDFTIMSSSWIEKLYHGAMSADEEIILQLVDEIPSEYTSLAHSLVDLVHNFRYDKIMMLTEPFSSQNCE